MRTGEYKIKKIVIVGAVALISILAITGSMFLKKNSNDVSNKNIMYTLMVKNNTNEIINDLELICMSGEQLQTLTNFLTKEQRAYIIDNQALINGDSIILKGKNNLGEEYERVIISDINKEQNGNIVININDVDDNGEILIAIELTVY